MNGRWLKFSLAVALLGAAGALALPRLLSAEQAGPARAGVLVCTLSGLVGLAIKRWSLQKSGLKAALGATTMMMFVRLALWAVGFAVLRKTPGAGLAFTAGFFTTFVVVMWLEIGFVFAAVRQRAQGVAA